MIKLGNLNHLASPEQLRNLPKGKLKVNTINAHSYNVAQTDEAFARALLESDVLLPDGIGVVMGLLLLTGKRVERTTGPDFFNTMMDQLNLEGGHRCFFLGSSPENLEMIRRMAAERHPGVLLETYSPPFADRFSEEENCRIIDTINRFHPDVLWVGMTAPKQEKWIHENFDSLDVVNMVAGVGAAFDFYSGNVRRAPLWMRNYGLEWVHRLLSDPVRLWRRYTLGLVRFFINVIREKLDYGKNYSPDREWI